MLNLQAIKNRRREPERDEKILSDHRQEINVTVGGIGNLARSGLSAVSGLPCTNKQTKITVLII